MERTLKIGNVGLGKVPRIAAILHNRLPAGTLKSLQKRGADLVEARIDLFHPFKVDAITTALKRIKELAKMPVIGTIRRPGDGGSKGIPEPLRLEIFKAVIPYVDCVDIEIDAPIVDDVIGLTKGKGRRVITSYHNFDETPPDRRLAIIIRQGKNRGGDIVKLAVMARETEDILRLMALTERYKELHLITIAMGKTGRISRLVAPFFGSHITYGYVTAPVAPGQFSVAQIKRVFDLIKG